MSKVERFPQQLPGLRALVSPPDEGAEVPQRPCILEPRVRVSEHLHGLAQVLLGLRWVLAGPAHRAQPEPDRVRRPPPSRGLEAGVRVRAAFFRPAQAGKGYRRVGLPREEGGVPQAH
ncbi:MAG: hypothetical protein M3R70_07220 [Actinomycetota bacterium]|nr:hypothetical protein [Actinomycetota bacterium]